MGVVSVLALKELVPHTCAYLSSWLPKGQGPRSSGEPTMVPVSVCLPVSHLSGLLFLLD